VIDAGPHVLKRRLGQLYALLNARDAHRKLILLYHSIGGGAEATAINAFRAHLEVVASTGQLLALRDLVQSPPDRGIAIAITFDDGYATLRDHVAEILADFGCAATVFLNVGEIADDERRPSRPEDGYYPGEQFLTWRDVDALVAGGWHIGSHGVRHVKLTSADTATVKSELSASKTIIEQHLGTTCDMLAYPWGRHNPGLRAEVRSAGYCYGFAGNHSCVTAKSDLLALPRINVANEYSRDDLAAILRGDWDYLGTFQHAKESLNQFQ
jgi:peptidoglycan/xylan/chitin deacetylase (PgdA/CDA1 family)